MNDDNLGQENPILPTNLHYLNKEELK